MNDVKVRFAPSPTGRLHVGGARTALFNWLFARKHHGKFLLRIEDTDKARSQKEFTDDILDGLKYIGLDFDGDIVCQSDRIEIHRKAAMILLEDGNAYRCFCDPEKLTLKRKQAQAAKQNPQYPGHCRNLSSAEIQTKLSKGEPYAVRFKVPAEILTFEDGVHGTINIDCRQIEDFILLRRDGSPAYMLSAVVDDAEMGITHVIRGDDHLSNTPKQILLHRALGKAQIPHFSHVPLILGPDKRRLSKRHGAVSINEYEKTGILGEALANYLALLGWSPGDDKELMTLGEMTQAFSSEGISGKSAIFDFSKLEWMNGKHISRMDTERLIPRITQWKYKYYNGEIGDISPERFIKTIELAKTRMKRISDIFLQDTYYFIDPQEYDAKGAAKYFKQEWLPDKLTVLSEDFQAMPNFIANEIEVLLRSRAEQWGLAAGKLIHPLRLALTGQTASPGLFEIMEVLGREQVIHRMKNAVDFIKSIGS